jgi:1,4-alpha-glucan branching enzyme
LPDNSEVYVIGEFTDWKIKPEYKMIFNENRARYDLEIPLKQGRYEYAYSLLNNETKQPDETFFEGNHANTENEYLILVYNRNLQYNYDELIGSVIFTTLKQ